MEDLSFVTPSQTLTSSVVINFAYVDEQSGTDGIKGMTKELGWGHIKGEWERSKVGGKGQRLEGEVRKINGLIAHFHYQLFIDLKSQLN